MKTRNILKLLSKATANLMALLLVLTSYAQTETNTGTNTAESPAEVKTVSNTGANIAEPAAEVKAAPDAAVPAAVPGALPAPPADPADTVKFTGFQMIGPAGGDIRSIAIDPRNRSNIYVSTLDAQIYGSGDAGRSWRLLANFNKPQLILDDLQVDNKDSRIIYASGHRHKEPGGFFKSSDGGLTWKEAKELKSEAIHALHQSDLNSNLLLAGTVTGLFRSTDRGETWQKVISSTMPVFIDSIAIDPKDTNIIYLGTTYRAYKSTDGGANWRLIKNGMIDDSDVFAIDIDPRDNNHIIASACSGIYESYNKGELWKKVQGIPSTSRRTRAIMFHPSLAGTVFAGTTEGFWMSSSPGAWIITTTKALEINSIAVHPDEPNKVYIATNNYGVMVSNDGGRSFNQANGNFTSRMIFSITPDIERSNRLYATTNNTATGGGFVFVSDDDGQSWIPSMRNLIANNDVPVTLLQDKVNPNIIYLGSNSGVFRSIDRGASWNKIVAKPTPKPKVTYKKVGKKRVAVKTPAVPVDPNVIPALGEKVNALAYTNDGKNGIYAATESGLYRTYDIDKGWQKVWQQSIVSTDLRQRITERVFVITVSPRDSNQLWIGTSRSGLLTSSDAGATWRTVADIPLNVPISAIEIPEARADNIFVGTAQSLYLSRDGGQKWSRRGGNLPLGNFASIIVNPNKPDEVFVASALENNGGIYTSQNGGMNWKRVDPKEWALPTTRIRTMIFDPNNPNRIFAGTHSGGIYRIDRTNVAGAGETRPRETTTTLK